MPDPASSGRRRVGLAQFHRDMERASAPLREMERVMWRATAPLRVAEEANKRIGRMAQEVFNGPNRYFAELLAEAGLAPPPRPKKTPYVAVDAPKPDPARPPAATSRRKRKKPRGKTADQRLAELWETDEGRFWLVATARSVGEVARRIGKGETQTKGSRMWVRHIRIARRTYRKLGQYERQEFDRRAAY